MFGKQITRLICISSARVQKSTIDWCQHWGLKRRRHRGAWTGPRPQASVAKDLEKKIILSLITIARAIFIKSARAQISSMAWIAKGRHQGAWDCAPCGPMCMVQSLQLKFPSPALCILPKTASTKPTIYCIMCKTDGEWALASCFPFAASQQRLHLRLIKSHTAEVCKAYNPYVW